MKYWSRDDTKEWINQLEHRIDDIDYYLDRTLAWCDEYGIDNQRVVFMCSFLTCIWVSQVRGEPISFIELMEMLGVEEWETSNNNEDKVYELDECFSNLDHYELLEQAVDRLRDAED
jgi:hypothetical protein